MDLLKKKTFCEAKTLRTQRFIQKKARKNWVDIKKIFKQKVGFSRANKCSNK